MADAKPKTVTVEIAKGRSLLVGGTHHNAGSRPEVNEDEVKGLMDGGFLVNPDAPEPIIAEGPTATRLT